MIDLNLNEIKNDAKQTFEKMQFNNIMLDVKSKDIDENKLAFNFNDCNIDTFLITNEKFKNLPQKINLSNCIINMLIIEEMPYDVFPEFLNVTNCQINKIMYRDTKAFSSILDFNQIKQQKTNVSKIIIDADSLYNISVKAPIGTLELIDTKRIDNCTFTVLTLNLPTTLNAFLNTRIDADTLNYYSKHIISFESLEDEISSIEGIIDNMYIKPTVDTLPGLLFFNTTVKNVYFEEGVKTIGPSVFEGRNCELQTCYPESVKDYRKMFGGEARDYNQKYKYPKCVKYDNGFYVCNDVLVDADESVVSKEICVLPDYIKILGDSSLFYYTSSDTTILGKNVTKIESYAINSDDMSIIAPKLETIAPYNIIQDVYSNESFKIYEATVVKNWLINPNDEHKKLIMNKIINLNTNIFVKNQAIKLIDEIPLLADFIIERAADVEKTIECLNKELFKNTNIEKNNENDLDR